MEPPDHLFLTSQLDPQRLPRLELAYVRRALVQRAIEAIEGEAVAQDVAHGHHQREAHWRERCLPLHQKNVQSPGGESLVQGLKWNPLL